MKKALTVALIGGAAALGFPAVAHATPEEDAVIAQMDAAGYHHAPISAVIDNAHNICERFGRGETKPQIAMETVNEVGITMDEAVKFVDVSVANLCPA
jgi:hypothetical protein